MNNLFLTIFSTIYFLFPSFNDTDMTPSELYTWCDGYARAAGRMECLTYEEEFDEFAYCMESNAFLD